MNEKHQITKTYPDPISFYPEYIEIKSTKPIYNDMDARVKLTF